jgi:hypothetical protein
MSAIILILPPPDPDPNDDPELAALRPREREAMLRWLAGQDGPPLRSKPVIMVDNDKNKR